MDGCRWHAYLLAVVDQEYDGSVELEEGPWNTQPRNPSVYIYRQLVASVHAATVSDSAVVAVPLATFYRDLLPSSSMDSTHLTLTHLQRSCRSTVQQSWRETRRTAGSYSSQGLHAARSLRCARKTIWSTAISARLACNLIVSLRGCKLPMVYRSAVP